MEIDIVSVPFNSTGRGGGVAAAPAALHAQGLMTLLRGALPDGWQPHEPDPVAIGDRTFLRNTETGLLNDGALVTMIDGVADAVAASHAAGRLPLLLGGDGPIVLGGLVEAGHRPEGPSGLLSLTGRECAWPPTASPTGQASDCTIGLALVAHTNSVLSGGLSRRLPLLAPPAVVLLGTRDAAELAAAGVPSLVGSIMIRSGEELNASLATNKATASFVLGRQISEAVERIRQTTASWWLHVDLSVLSPEAMPAMEYRQPGGLSWEQLTILTRAALAAPGLLGWSVAGYDADLDLDRSCAGRVVDYLSSSVGALPTGPAAWAAPSGSQRPSQPEPESAPEAAPSAGPEPTPGPHEVGGTHEDPRGAHEAAPAGQNNGVNPNNGVTHPGSVASSAPSGTVPPAQAAVQPQTVASP